MKGNQLFSPLINKNVGTKALSVTKSPISISDPITTEIRKLMTRSISCLLTSEELKEMAIYLIKIAHYSCGLKETDPPYNSHKDLMIRYIQEVFNLNSVKLKQYQQSVLNGKNEQFKPAVRCWIKNANNLPTMDADGSVDPYFICYLLGSTLTTPFKSNYIQKEHNPVWNREVIIPIDTELVNSSRGIMIEIWDHDSISFVELLGKLLKSRSLTNLYHGCRDLIQLIGYKLCGSKVDDKIGQIYLPINTIPSTEMSLSTTLIDSNGYSTGTINLVVIWGTQLFSDLTSKLKMIPIHSKILRFLLSWHCRDITFRFRNREIPYSSFDFCALFYLPALTLINQMRIQINIGHWDSILFCHCVAGLILIEEIKTKRSNNSDKQRKDSVCDPICLRTLLISLLSSIDLTDPKRKYENYLTKPLENIQSTLSNEIFDFYKPMVPSMLTNLIEKQKNYQNYHETIQFLRLFNRYDRLFVKYSFRHRLNQILSTIILNYFDRNIAIPERWTTLINSLEAFQENISRYWCQSISSIIGSSGQIRIKKSFDYAAVKFIKETIKLWNKDSHANHQIMLNVYFFVHRLDLLFCCRLIEEHNRSDGESTVNYVRRVETINRSIRQLELKHKQVEKETMSSSRKLFKNLMSILSRNVWLTKEQNLISDQMTSLLPASIASITAQTISQIQVKTMQHVILAPRDLQLNQDFQFNVKCNKLGLVKVFPFDLMDKWLEMMTVQAQEAVDKSVNHEMCRDVGKEGTKMTNHFNQLFYDLLGCTLYFFVTFDCWGENMLQKSVALLISKVENFCEKLTFQSLNHVISASSSLDASLRLIRTLNGLSIVREKYLRRHLVEILTDSKSIDIWKCFWAYFALEPVFLDDCKVSNCDLVKKSSDFDKIVVQLMNFLIMIENLCHDININEDSLIGKLSEIYLKHHLQTVKDIVETADPKSSESTKKDYNELIITFANDASKILSDLISDDIKANLLLDMRHKLTICFPSMIRSLSEAYKADKNTNKARSHFTRIQIVKLSLIGQGFLDEIARMLGEIRSPQSGTLRTLIEAKVDFSLDLSSIASEIICGKVKSKKSS